MQEGTNEKPVSNKKGSFKNIHGKDSTVLSVFPGTYFGDGDAGKTFCYKGRELCVGPSVFDFVQCIDFDLCIFDSLIFPKKRISMDADYSCVPHIVNL